MKTTTKEKLKYLRFVPLLACAVVAMDFGGLVLAVLPFVGVRDVFTWLPFLQFLGLTGLLVATMLGRVLIPELAKHLRSGTLKGV